MYVCNSVIQLPPITWHTACAIPGVSDWRGCYRDAIEIGYQLRPTSPKWSTAPATQHSTADHHHHHHVVVRIPIAFTWLQTGWCLAEITVERSDMSQKELYMPRQRDPVREGRRGRGRGGYESPAGRGHLTRACHFSRDKWTTREIKLITDDRRFAPKENLPPTFAHTKKKSQPPNCFPHPVSLWGVTRPFSSNPNQLQYLPSYHTPSLPWEASARTFSCPSVEPYYVIWLGR